MVEMTRKEAKYILEKHATEEFIQEARKIHGTKYDYSKTWIECDEEALNEFIKMNGIVIIGEG